MMAKLRRIFSSPPNTWRCHTCEKDIPDKVMCDYDWSGTCSASQFNVMQDRGVPKSIGNVMAKLLGGKW